MTVAELVIDDLTVEERLELIERLWNSLDEADAELTPAQVRELDRRVAAAERGEDSTISWDEAMARVRQRLG